MKNIRNLVLLTDEISNKRHVNLYKCAELKYIWDKRVDSFFFLPNIYNARVYAGNKE